MEPMSDQVLSLAAQIVSAHVAHNSVPSQEIPALIQSVYTTLTRVGSPPVDVEKPQPAVPVKKSVFPDHIVCLEDGKKLKMLKRHLQTHFSLTPEQYREKWGLPRDYPMVAPNYAEKRSVLAKSIGLGRKPGTTLPEPALEPEPKIEPSARRGRKKTI
jgi:predicted transcriptional regulator